MALTIDSENAVVVARDAPQLILPPRVGRKGAVVQLQADGFYWISLGSVGVKGDSFRARGWEIVDLGVGFKRRRGNGTDYFEDFVTVWWEGAVDPVTGGSSPTADVRVIEVS